MTSPLMDPEEDNSNFVSSSGSSPVLFSDPEAVENILQITSAKNAPSELGKRQRRRVPLEPFVHQVGGHFPMACLAQATLCKPLNEREYKFYKSMTRSLVPFVPRFEGTMRVEVSEDDHGYITLTGHPPPNFRGSKSSSIHQQMLQLRQDISRTKSRSSSSSYSKDDESEDTFEEETSTNASIATDVSSNSEVYCNPWALKCHRDHLKKLGILSGLGSHSPRNQSPEDQQLQAKLIKKPQNYLLLENLVSTYRYPCVLDLKVGARQYADDVSAAKKARKIAKAQNTTSATLGLRLTGMQVYDHESGRYLCHNKYFGRSLNRETFEEVIEDFFKINNDMVSEEDCAGDQIRIDVINRVIATIEEMITVLNKLDSYRFFTASLLVTYDGQLTTAQSDDQSDQLPAAQPDLKYDVRMIDFAHSTHRGLRDEVVHEGPDANFIHGLRTLLQILETLLSKHHQS